MQENGTPAEESDRRGYAIDPYEVCGRGEINFCRGERTKELLRYRKEKDMYILTQSKRKIIDTNSKCYFCVVKTIYNDYSLFFCDKDNAVIADLGDYSNEERAYQELRTLASNLNALTISEE